MFSRLGQFERNMWIIIISLARSYRTRFHQSPFVVYCLLFLRFCVRLPCEYCCDGECSDQCTTASERKREENVEKMSWVGAIHIFASTFVYLQKCDCATNVWMACGDRRAILCIVCMTLWLRVCACASYRMAFWIIFRTHDTDRGSASVPHRHTRTHQCWHMRSSKNPSANGVLWRRRQFAHTLVSIFMQQCLLCDSAVWTEYTDTQSEGVKRHFFLLLKTINRKRKPAVNIGLFWVSVLPCTGTTECKER